MRLVVETLSPLPDEVFAQDVLSRTLSLPQPPEYHEAMRTEAKRSPLFYRGPVKESVKSAIVPVKDNSSLQGSSPRHFFYPQQTAGEPVVLSTRGATYQSDPVTASADHESSTRPLEVRVEMRKGNTRVSD